MHIEYAISLWNYRHYAGLEDLEHQIALIRRQNYGVELWADWRAGEDLFDQANRERLRPLLEGMTVSLHTSLGNSFVQHQKQIDAAAAWGGRVVVVHSRDLVSNADGRLDVGLTRDVVAYAAEHHVQIALENGQLPFLLGAVQAVEGLGVCLDVGHVYLTPDPMRDFLEAFRDRLIHLHLQDVLTPAERGLPETGDDHYIPGTGGIPVADWELLADTLRAIDYDGIAVFEIRPRNPLQTALLGTRFMHRLVNRAPR